MLNYWLDRMPPFSPAGSSIEKLKDQISSICIKPRDTTIYNYWLLHSIPVSTTTTTKTGTKSSTEMLNYWLDRMPPSSSVPSRFEKLNYKKRFQALVKKTNLEFISFLNKLIEDKKMELNEEDKEIKDEYAELNRTREALFRAYNRQLPDKRLEDLRRKLSEKEVQYRELMSMHRLRRMTRDLHLDTPWININYPGGVIRESLRRKKSRNEFYESYMDSAPGEVSSVVSNDSYLRIDDSDETVSHKTGSKGTKKYTPKTSTMSLGDILWKSLGKYLPFSGKNHANFNSIPLEVHYRVGKDVAHLTIRVGDSEEATTQQLDGLRNT
ncbi:uncharacterized protein [Halyomorpha halys]